MTLILTLALSLGCMPDDVDTASGADTDSDDTGETGETGQATIEGNWRSEGADVSYLLGLFDIVSVDASFEAEGSYEVLAYDTANAVITYSGTYTVDTSTTLHSIVLEQSVPESATSRGIFEISGTTMTYEVVQDGLGYTAPTPETGFGSTAGTGVSEGDNTQIFQRQ